MAEIKRTKVQSLSSLGKLKEFKLTPSAKKTQKGEVIYNFAMVKSDDTLVTGIVSQEATRLLTDKKEDAKGFLQVSSTEFEDNNHVKREAWYLEKIPLAGKEATLSFKNW